MAKRKNKKHAQKKSKPSRPRGVQVKGTPAKETQAAEVTTVAWLLSTLATLCAGILGAVVWLAAPVDAGLQSLWHFFPLLSLFSALVTGFVGLALGAVVMRVRAVAPPRKLTFGAALICVAPWLFLMAKIK